MKSMKENKFQLQIEVTIKTRSEMNDLLKFTQFYFPS